MNSILNGEVEDPFEGEDPVSEAEKTAEVNSTASSQALDDYEYDAEEDDAFFTE